MRETTQRPQASTQSPHRDRSSLALDDAKLAKPRLRARLQRWAGSALVVGAFLALPVRAAHAADDDATTGMARERFKEGVSFFDKKEYDKARAAFLQAYALKHHPAVLLNLAQSELRSGHEADAATHFAQFLRESKEATDAERQSAEAGLSAAKALAAEITVNVDEEGAAVSLDGTSQGQSPLPGALYLPPGPHTITAKKDGRETSVQVTAAAGQSTSTHLRFKKAAAPAGDAEKKEEETSEQEPAKSEETSASTEQTAEVSAGTSSSSKRKPFVEWVTHSPVGIAGGALTIVGVGAGVGFAFASNSNYDSANSIADQIRKAAALDMLPNTSGPCTGDIKGKLVQANYKGGDDAAITAHANEYIAACKKYKSKADSGDSAKQMAAISFVVAGVAAAGTLAFYFLEGSESSSQTAGKKPRRRSATIVAPWISSTERGLFLVGEF